MRSIWRQPPGGFTSEVRRVRRQRRIRATTASLVVLAVALTLARSAMLQTEPVTEAEALATYRAGVDPTRPETEQSQRAPTRPRRRVARVTTGSSAGSVTKQGTDLSDADAGESRPRSAPTQAPPERDEARPLEGVYAWDVEGYEEASGGTRRDLPRESHRIITHGPGGTWVEHHIFSREREEWFEVDRSDAGFLTDAVRNRVEFGPVEVDKTVTFTPSVLGARVPFRVDDGWSGSWTGRTEGDYNARIFEHVTMVIDGERVEVWGTEVLMRMRGEVDGEVLTRSWIAPDHGLMVKQHQVISIETGPYSYHSEWTGQVRSLTPAT